MSTESLKSVDQVAGDWLAQRDAGQWTENDQARLDRWLDESPLNRVAYLRLEYVWERSQRLRALGTGTRSNDPPPPGAWLFSPFFEQHPGQDVTAQEADAGARTTRRHGARHRVGMALAASVVLATVLGAIWGLWPQATAYSTPVGGIASVPLADGSKVTLNTNSQIRVAVTERERRIELEHGEAYFEVARDPKRPFVVRAGDKRIIAVGTSFSVRRNGDDVDVTVTEGRVRLEGTPTVRIQQGNRSREPAPEVLSAGTVARASDEGVLLESRPITEAQESLSWREGVLVFHDMTLADAAAEFNRYNVRKIVIDDPRAAAFHVAGSFRADNVDAFLRLLERGYPIRVEEQDDRFVLMGR